jgi:hypothetical protein
VESTATIASGKVKLNVTEILADFTGNDPVDERSLSENEFKSGHALPSDFKDLLRTSNGGEGYLGNQYLMLWSIEEIIDYNAQYDVEKYAPGLLIFGSSGGGEAYAFDYRSGKFDGVVKIPFVGMDLKYTRALASTFTDFLRGLRNE